MKAFITLNPHIENLSKKNLIKTFRYILQKYYRGKLGARYSKHKDKQYQICVFPESGSTDFKQPHLHIIVQIPCNELEEFYFFVASNMNGYYPSLTTNCQVINNTEKDFANVLGYCLKEEGEFLVNDDLFERDYIV